MLLARQSYKTRPYTHIMSSVSMDVKSVSKMVNGSRYYRALESVSIASALSSALYHLPMPDSSPSNADSLNSNFVQLGRRSGGRPRRTVYPRRLPVNCDTHYVSRHRTHNLPIVSPTRYP